MKRIFVLTLTLLLITTAAFAQSNSTTTSSPNVAKTKAFRPTKSQITTAQEKLRTSGKYSGATDGKYNDAFRAGIKVFQEENGLEQNGRLDEATISKMGIELTDSQKGIETSSESSQPKRTVFRANKEQIMSAQKMLNTNGSYKGEPSGKYDDDLRASIKEYQAANGLSKTGALNRPTLEKLGIKLTEAQSAIPVNPADLSDGSSPGSTTKRGPVFRASKEQIIAVQKMLKSRNLYNGEESGKLNDETRAAIKEWQKQNGVKETGTLNKVTLEAMKIELSDKQKGM